MIYLLLFYEFFKIGLFAVGGGLATIPFLYNLAEVYPWFTSAQLTDMIALSESTPGPVGINMATFAGYTAGFSEYQSFIAGFAGGLTATLAIILPCVIIIIIIAKFLNRFNENEIVKSVFLGLRPAVAGLIGLATLEIIKITLINIPRLTLTNNFLYLFEPVPIIIFIIMLFSLIKFKLNPLWCLLAGAVLGIVINI